MPNVGLMSSQMSPSSASPPPRRKEWDDLFLNSNYLARIRQAGINGRLRSSRFRSVCWKVKTRRRHPRSYRVGSHGAFGSGPLFFADCRAPLLLLWCHSTPKSVHTDPCSGSPQLYLEALPEERSQWINKTKEHRAHYEKIKETVRVPPCGRFSRRHENMLSAVGCTCA